MLVSRCVLYCWLGSRFKRFWYKLTSGLDLQPSGNLITAAGTHGRTGQPAASVRAGVARRPRGRVATRVSDKVSLRHTWTSKIVSEKRRCVFRPAADGRCWGEGQ